MEPETALLLRPAAAAAALLVASPTTLTSSLQVSPPQYLDFLRPFMFVVVSNLPING
jgi:hypothetical protein